MSDINYINDTNDFVGFTFNGKHSYKDFNIYHVSDNNFYKDDIIPQLNDQTTTIIGLDETYYFGSDYQKTEFSVNIAYDNMTETQFNNFKKWLGTKEPCPLIFDETPYKYYIAKVLSQPSLSFLCFEQPDGSRIYKGEGSIPFVCYFPFAKSLFQSLNNIPPELIDLRNDISEKKGYDIESTHFYWESTCRLLDNLIGYNTTTTDNYDTIKLYNGGDLPTDWKLWIPFEDLETLSITINLMKKGEQELDEDIILETLILNEIKKDSTYDNFGVLLDSKLQLVKGAYKTESELIYTGKQIYNNKLLGTWFKIPIMEKEEKNNYYIKLSISVEGASMIYDYLYY